MHKLLPTLDDLRAMVVPDSPVLEDVIRVSIVYLVLLLLFRFVRRGIGGLAMADVLLLVIIADALQNGMVGEYSALTNALVVGATLVFWDYALDYIGYRYPPFRRLLKPRPMVVIRDGAVIPEVARKMLLTEDELAGQLRLQGVAHLEEVEISYVESSGEISVLTNEPEQKGRHRQDGLTTVS
jgi:uncharacterized membrane protein YcaP (DUF421 family)